MKIEIELKSGTSYRSDHDGFTHIVECGTDSDGTLAVDTCREVTLRDVFNGIGIDAYGVRFGIAQRDSGLEIMIDGKLVCSVSHSGRIDLFAEEKPGQ